MSKKVFVAQPYQEGTSFSEIRRGIEKSCMKVSHEINILDYPYSFDEKEEGVFDDYREIFLHVQVIRDLLKENFSQILFLDFFAPGLETLAFFRDISKQEKKMGALIHGGTFVENDLYDWEWLKQSEKTWFEIFDLLYVPSKFLKNQIPLKYQNKVHVFPWGMDNYDEEKIKHTWHERAIDIIFPHRLDKDKGIDDFIELVKRMPDCLFAVTVPQKQISGKYYNTICELSNCDIIMGEDDDLHKKTLQNSKFVFSSALQENFGYSVIKSVCEGCIPILPNRLVYPEIFGIDMCYNSLDDAEREIRRNLSNYENTKILSLRKKFLKFSFKDIINHFYE